MRFLKRLWPQSLAGQLVVFLLTAIVLAQAIAFIVVTDERRIAVERTTRDQVVARTVDFARLVAESPIDLQNRMTRNASDRRLRFEISDASLLDREDIDERDSVLERRIADELGPLAREVRVVYETEGFNRWLRVAKKGEAKMPASPRADGPPPRLPAFRDFVGLTISINLAPGTASGGRWLNMRTLVRTQPPTFEGLALASVITTAVVLVLIVVFTVRRTTRPLRELAGAAERFGRGEAVAAPAEHGPSDVRQTVVAFNAMQDRLKRFVDDRTRMLAAISHDLRTPITSLRLRAEMVEDAEARAAMLRTLADMQTMVEATLSFAKDEATAEATRTVDLGALLDSLCDDLAAMGKDATFTESDERLAIACRPTALGRALRNLIENAVNYGARARVSVRREDDAVIVEIDDDGPGIAEPDRMRVFEPFVRLETSRSKQTGGIGLGLSIARTIIHAHGGEIGLSNRPEGGLRATVHLPIAKI
ncbi:MAG: ATPase, histidine kinase, gyrase and HSP90-like domain protein [Rhodospirillales bacterium]|nr:ATPase, histidine kinase, gyrase and HSP90-like domain protein [Rhodospirillales bacterium]